MKKKITKKMIEKRLGYKITKFKLESLYKDGECIGLNIMVEPKQKLEFVNIPITIGRSSDFNGDEKQTTTQEPPKTIPKPPEPPKDREVHLGGFSRHKRD